MNLHRTDIEPEWRTVPKDSHNRWQRLAAITGGYVTPGNCMTGIGLVIVAFGLAAMMDKQYLLSAVLLVVGRSCDLVDGWLADRTGTKSPLGELFDAAADKIGTAAIVVVLGVAELVAWWALAALLVPHLVISLLAFVARRRHVQLHPSRLGKISMAIAWVSLTAFVVVPLLGHSVALNSVAYVLLLLSAAMATMSAVGYMRTVFAK